MNATDREVARQDALAGLAILDTPPEREFDALAELARQILGTRMSSITLIDERRQWFKARCGLADAETDREPALCSVVVENETALLVGDASVDPRFANNPFVTDAPNIRFYAGVPISVATSEGTRVPVGTICVLDDRVRDPRPDVINTLNGLALIAEALLEARAQARRAAAIAEDRRLSVDRLERERRQFKQAEHMAAMGSWRYDLEGARTEWSDGVFAIHELPVSGGVPSKGILDFFEEVDRAAFLQAVHRTLDTGEPLELDADFTTAKGGLRRVRCMGEIELSKGKPIALIGLIQDITERHRMELALLHRARTDYLTQLPNRAYFNRVLDERLLEIQATGGEFAVMLVDLDGFKGVNDALGHAAGDTVLCRVTDKLNAPLMVGCFVARLGGDEFAIIAPPTMDRKALGAVVSKLLCELHVSVEGPDGYASVSGTIGISWAGAASCDREVVLREADAALYVAKGTRKGTAWTHGTLPMLRAVGA